MFKFFYDLGPLEGLLVLSILYLLYWYKRPKHFPPGPRGIPILGYLPMYGKRQYEIAAKLSQKHGPILGIRCGSFDTVILNDYQSINGVCILYFLSNMINKLFC